MYAKGTWHNRDALKCDSYCVHTKGKLQLLLVKIIEFQRKQQSK